MAIRDLSGWPLEYKRQFYARWGRDEYGRPFPQKAPMATLNWLDRKPQRAWINQPSKLQPFHKYHGTRVLAMLDYPGTANVYFLDGDVISQQLPTLALSAGWP